MNPCITFPPTSSISVEGEWMPKNSFIESKKFLPIFLADSIIEFISIPPVNPEVKNFPIELAAFPIDSATLFKSIPVRSLND